MMRAAVVLAALACSGAATAQDAKSLAIYRQLESTYPAPTPARLLPAMMAAVARTGSVWKTCVPKTMAIVSVTPATADQIVIAQIVQQKAHNGWLVTATPGGCPQTEPIRLLATEQADGTLSVGVIGYGDSLSWPSLVRDVQVSAMVAADRTLQQADTAECADKAPRLVDSQISRRDPTLGAPSYGVIFAGAWQETWTFKRCARTATARIDFQADGNGGANFQVDR